MWFKIVGVDARNPVQTREILVDAENESAAEAKAIQSGIISERRIPTAVNWYYARGKDKRGPISLSQLRELLSSGRLHPTDMLLQEGSQKWVVASSVEELFVGMARCSETQPLARENTMFQQKWIFAICAVCLVIIAVVVVFGVWPIPQIREAQQQEEKRKEDKRKSDARIQVKTELPMAVESYHIDHHEQWPESLDVLLTRDQNGKGPYLKGPDALIDPWGKRYQYDS